MLVQPWPFVERTRRVYTSLKTSSNKLRRVDIVLWGYSFAVWLYVIAMQLRYPESPYWPFAVWIPVRLDYLGEVAFSYPSSSESAR